MKSKTPQLLILIGAPGSGKSTFAKYHIRTHLNWVRICRDDFRIMQFSQTFLSEEMEEAVTEMMLASIEKMLTKNINIIADATHTKSSYLSQYIKCFGHLADIEFKLFEAPKEELLLRCEKRNKAMGKKVTTKNINHHLFALEGLKKSFDFSPRRCQPRINLIQMQNGEKQKVIICDLDGALKEINNYIPLDISNTEAGQQNKTIAQTLSYYRQMDHHVLTISGREEYSRTEMINFLKEHDISYDEFWMRPFDIHEKGSVLK